MEQPNIFMSYLRVTQHMSQQFRSHFGRLDLTFPQALVLTVLGEDGPVPISALAERTGSANSTVFGHCGPAGKAGAGQTAAQRDGPAGDLCLRHGEVQRPAGQGGH
ncbi:MarR family winged helix-turn-helix transcriptional regulator [Flavonifractor plautii]|uniref:MarR family winged helix-turn-helix transcriptional regulator n=1 Tax=Flavonifractor plautii TaxID=292800 RepID=UPI003EEE1792